MKYTYSSLFQFPGISHQQDEDIVIVRNSHEDIEVYFTKNVDEYCHAIDTGLACSNLMLNGVFGGITIDNFPHELQEEINRIKESRSNRLSSGALLAVSITGDEELNVNERLQREVEGFIVYFDAANKDAIKKRHQSFIYRTIASIAAASDHEYGFRRISDGVYFRDENRKLVYSFTSKVTATLTISRDITSDFVELSKQYLRLAKNTEELKSVFRLYVQSLDTNQENFRSYLLSWTAIEILVNKIFKSYRDEFMAKVLSDHDSPGMKQFLEQLGTVMNDKYSLLDKFALISSFLGKNQEEEISLFKRCKKLRDDISHGTAIEETSLPVEKLRILLAGYLFSHLQREQNPQ